MCRKKLGFSKTLPAKREPTSSLSSSFEMPETLSKLLSSHAISERFDIWGVIFSRDKILLKWQGRTLAFSCNVEKRAFLFDHYRLFCQLWTIFHARIQQCSTPLYNIVVYAVESEIPHQSLLNRDLIPWLVFIWISDHSRPRRLLHCMFRWRERARHYLVVFSGSYQLSLLTSYFRLQHLSWSHLLRRH